MRHAAAVIALLTACTLTSHADAQEPAQPSDSFTILRLEPVGPPGALGFGIMPIPTTLATKDVAESMTTLMATMKQVFAGTPAALGDLSLDEIEVHLNISGEGKVQVVVGATVGAAAGIKVTFKRAPTTSAAARPSAAR
jgi:hypothetical protein